MSMITVNRTEELISGSVNGQPFSVTFDEKKYTRMKELELAATKVDKMEELLGMVKEFNDLAAESYKEIVETITPYIHVNKSTNKFYLKYGDKLSTKAIPQALVDRMLTSVEKGIEIKPLIKCWVRFLRNPKFSKKKAELFASYINATYTDYDKVDTLVETQGLSLAKAGQLATTPQVAITLEGLIVGYKVSTEILKRYELNDEEEVVTKSRFKKNVDPDTGLVTYDEPEHVEDRLFQPAVKGTSGDAFWCVGNGKSTEGHIIRVGCSHFLDSWDKVDCNDDRSCVKGLHVGGLKYISGYQGEGTVTHNVLIDPMDIGAVCDMYRNNDSDGAIRVRRYFVHSSFAGVNKNIYHSSKFAAMNDEEYRASIEAIVKATEIEKEELEMKHLH